MLGGPHLKRELNRHERVDYGATLFRTNYYFHVGAMIVAFACHVLTLVASGKPDPVALMGLVATLLLMAGRRRLSLWDDPIAAHQTATRAWMAIVLPVLLSGMVSGARRKDGDDLGSAWFDLTKTWWGTSVALLLCMLIGFLHMSTVPSNKQTALFCGTYSIGALMQINRTGPKEGERELGYISLVGFTLGGLCGMAWNNVMMSMYLFQKKALSVENPLPIMPMSSFGGALGGGALGALGLDVAAEAEPVLPKAPSEHSNISASELQPFDVSESGRMLTRLRLERDAMLVWGSNWQIRPVGNYYDMRG